MADYELLKRLCEARGISGDEGDVREMILHEVRPYADTISVTPLGNLIVSVKGKQPAKTRLMINAHMDEVGFIVTQIREDGTLVFPAWAALTAASSSAAVCWLPENTRA